jgi:FkbM family methyltransferase
VRQALKATLRLAYRLIKAPEPPPTYGLHHFFPLLRRLGFNPQRIFDVGANHGNWSRAAAHYFPRAAFTLIEPQGHLRECIQDLIEAGHQIEWISAGCSDESGTLPFIVNDRRDDSSTFIQVTQQGQSTGTNHVPTPVITLNQLAISRGVPAMVKIDAEGFDLKVLSGASDLFGKTEIFLVEAQICSTAYDNSTVKVITYMDDRGYRLMDITDLNRSPKQGVLWLCEFVFVRKDSALLNSTDSYD